MQKRTNMNQVDKKSPTLFDINYRHFFGELQEIIATQSAACACAEYVANDLLANKVKRFEYYHELNDDLSAFKCSKFRKPSDIKREMRDTLARVLFVRLISALEVFLINQIRTAFIVDKKLFMKSGAVYEFGQAELLAMTSISSIRSKILGKICRDLTSGGYSKIVDFYSKYFSINLNSTLPGKERMTDYHEHRHLLVHRLGRTDSIFRKKYNTLKSGIHIDESFLYQGVSDFNKFAEDITKQVVRIFTPKSDEELKAQLDAERIIELEIEIFKPACRAAEVDFEFLVSDDYTLLRDLIISIDRDSENQKSFKIGGTFNQIRRYLAILESHSLKKEITYTIASDYSTRRKPLLKPARKSDAKRIKERLKKKKKYSKIADSLSESELLKIQMTLPIQPWENGVHRIVAKELGMKLREVSAGIKILIQRGIFKNQRNGVIIDDILVAGE